MPVTRCPNCGRGHAGYLDREKELSDLTLDEIRTEIAKYEAKGARIRDYMAGLQDRTVAQQARQVYPDGVACPDCGHGWREFDNHRKDLEQLTMDKARAALGANSRWLNRLRGQHGIATNANL